MKQPPGPEVLEAPANAAIIGYLRSSATPHRPGHGMEYGGWELMTHPDLGEMFGKLAGRSSVVPVFGRPAVVEHGVIAAVAVGTTWLLFRLPSPPAGVEMNKPITALEGTGWYAVSAWQPDSDGDSRLKSVLRDALEFAVS
ncbi:hypothetical protein [Catelliglobosispora koreensis]|uniref:hypothetical protein n=1 Tax=Catelliglobosispora koreensis TaxID=129052 RepID=UPI0003794898|nr:hypothetical protein [Catelliglobosispora koreensis]